MLIPDKENFNSRVNLQERNIKLKFPEFYQFLMDNHDIYPGNSIQEKMYMFYNNIHEPYKCEHCKNPTKFLSFHKGYRRFCCGRCTTFDPERMKKSKLTWIEKYGENYYECFNKKGKQTKLERYGDENYNNINKCKQTKLERYGDENYSNSIKAAETRKTIYSEEFIKAYKEKAKQTCLERYGVENPMQSEIVREKIKNTKLKRYGDSYYTNLEKAKQTCLKRYGVENPMQSEIVQNKAKQTNLKKYGVEWGILNSIIRDKNELSRKQYYIKKHDLNDIDENGYWICKCPHPGCNICEEKSYKISSTQFYGRKQAGVEPCTNILPIYGAANTSIESFIRNLLSEYNIDFECNVRNVISPKELDIYIPSKNMAIECNGVYWHSKCDKEYHINKYLQCKNKNIQLISIWEDWIKNKPEIVKSIILSKLGIYKERIGARKCIVKEISSKESTSFLIQNHIQGRTNANIKLGLYYNNELVGVMTFAKRSKLSGSKQIIENEWELSRFCTKIGTQIIGAAGKLLNYFIKHYNPKLISSFASNDISDGNLYKKLGFESNNHITQSYWYVEKDKYIRYHRTSFSKPRLKQLGYNVDGKTEEEIMMDLPFYKIYDSGHVKYILKI